MRFQANPCDVARGPWFRGPSLRHWVGAGFGGRRSLANIYGLCSLLVGLLGLLVLARIRANSGRAAGLWVRFLGLCDRVRGAVPCLRVFLDSDPGLHGARCTLDAGAGATGAYARDPGISGIPVT